MHRFRAVDDDDDDEFDASADSDTDVGHDEDSDNDRHSLSKKRVSFSNTLESSPPARARVLVSDLSSVRKFVPVDELGAEYRGEKTSRAQFEQDDVDDEDDEDDNDASNDDESIHDDEDEDNDNSSAQTPALSRAQLAAELQSIRESAAAPLFAPQTQASAQSSNIAKAAAIRRQRAEYETLFNWRIRAQPAIEATNKIPAYQTLGDDSGAERIDSERRDRAISAVFTFIESLIELQQLRSQSQSVEWDRSQIKRQRLNDSDDSEVIEDVSESMGYLSSYLDSYSEAQQPLRDAVLTKWHDRTLSAAGITASAQPSSSSSSLSSNSSVLAKPVLDQITDILTNKAKLIRRTRLNRSINRLIGPRLGSEGSEGTGGDSKSTSRQSYDSDIYDDNDWYYQQLHELTAASSAGTVSLVDAAKVASKLKRTSLRANVDRRASKGRKLRYTVEAKLTNFMAPALSDPANEVAIGALVAKLFGR